MTTTAYKSFMRAARTRKLVDSNGQLRIPWRGPIPLWLAETIPLWAEQLARELVVAEVLPVPAAPRLDVANMTPKALWQQRNLLEPPISLEAWQKWVGLVCAGVRAGLRSDRDTNSALSRVGLPRWLMLRYLRCQPALRMSYAAAKRAGLRRRWPRELVENILSDIATTGMSTRQACANRGVNPRNFYMLSVRDRELEREYLDAKEFQRLTRLEELDDTVTKGVNDMAALRAAKRHVNQQLHRIDQLVPVRLRNRQREIADPRAADLIARRRRAAAHRRRHRSES
jgi:hypothetical protein